MKKMKLFLCVSVSLVIFVNASVWEGMAALGEELPETGLFIATNSFPVNTVAIVTNLENGKTVSLVVTSRLENSGLLALLSRDAADAIDLQGLSPSRISMSQDEEQITFSAFTEDSGKIEDGKLTGEPGEETVVQELPKREDPPVLPIGEDYELSLVPHTLRPPEEKAAEPDPEYFVQTIDPALAGAQAASSADYIDPSLFIEPIAEPAPKISSVPPAPVFQVPKISSASPTPVFQVPMISSFEKGKYYLQIAAYSRAETVKSEIAKIDSKLPVAIMNVGSAEKPVYRVLIGPVNPGESGALLQRFKATYADAFLWLGK